MAATHLPGASVSVVARRYDVNANQVFRWRRLDERSGSPTPASSSSSGGLEYVVHGLGEIAAARELRSLSVHASFQFVDERSAQFLSDGAALVDAPAVDGALDLEQPIHALHDLQRQG